MEYGNIQEKRCPSCMKPKWQSPICEHCGWDEEKVQRDHLPPGTILADRYLLGRDLDWGLYRGFDLLEEKTVVVHEYLPLGGVRQIPGVFLEMRDHTRSWFEECRGFVYDRACRMKQDVSFSHISQVLDVILDYDTVYTVMEDVEGVPLTRFREKFSDPGILIKAALPMISDLYVMNRNGAVYGDIDPDNIICREDGFLHFMERDYDGRFLLEPYSSAWRKYSSFQSVDVLRSKPKLTPAADVYSVCAVLTWCVSGKEIPSAVERIMEDSFDAHSFLPHHPGLADILNRGLAVNPGDRIQNLDILCNALEQIS